MVTIPTDTVVVPLASEDDARSTCAALSEYVESDAHVVLVYVVEKAGGAPDKASVEQREQVAAELFDLAREQLEADGRSIDERVLYGTDIADTIFAAAREEGAKLVVFSPREASRLSRFLSGDTALDLVTNPDYPVLVLPDPSE